MKAERPQLLAHKCRDAVIVRLLLFRMNISHCGGFLMDLIATALVVTALKADCWYSYRGNVPIYGNIIVRVNLWSQCFTLLDENDDNQQQNCELFNLFDIPGWLLQFYKKDPVTCDIAKL